MKFLKRSSLWPNEQFWQDCGATLSKLMFHDPPLERFFCQVLQRDRTQELDKTKFSEISPKKKKYSFCLNE